MTDLLQKIESKMEIDGKMTLQRRGRSRVVATAKMERFVRIVNDFQPLTIITKRSILDVAAALDPPPQSLIICINLLHKVFLSF